MIFATHGVVSNYNPNIFCHKNFLDYQYFVNHLKLRQDKYVPLSEALKGRGDAFTIDDATYAAYDAAKLLREAGHHVTVFINPYYIVEKKYYWFLKLNYLLDNYSFDHIKFKNKEFPMDTYKHKLYFRKQLKADISGFSSEEKRCGILKILFDQTIEDHLFPRYLKTLNKEDIIELQKLGVDIQNHGWTHRELTNVQTEDIVKEIELGREWIRDNLNYTSNFYCVPFGTAMPPKNLPGFECWFLLSHSVDFGFYNKNVYNRTTFY